MIVGPNYTAPRFLTGTVWATTLVLLEFLHTFEEGGGASKWTEPKLHSALCFKINCDTVKFKAKTVQ